KSQHNCMGQRGTDVPIARGMVPALDIAGNRPTAKAAGLHYVLDGEPGLSRVRRGKTFTYRDAKGRAVRDARTLDRIRSLVIPPAWGGVWIWARAAGDAQA